jgi:hypothetical protein
LTTGRFDASSIIVRDIGCLLHIALRIRQDGAGRARFGWRSD